MGSVVVRSDGSVLDEPGGGVSGSGIDRCGVDLVAGLSLVLQE